jgi:hypothetical protein
MAEQANPYGYDAVNEVAKGGRYLNFKKGDKGRTIQVRIASEPRYILQHWVMDQMGKQSPINCSGEDCTYCGKSVLPKNKLAKVAKWGWIVIDRTDEEVKVFTGPTLIARSIKEISELADMRTKKVMWGNPMTFDIQIRRDELPGAGYYNVIPVVGTQGEITAEEKDKVAKAGFDLETELQGSKKSENTGAYTPKEEIAPEDVVGPNDVPTNLGESAGENDPPF